MRRPQHGELGQQFFVTLNGSIDSGTAEIIHIENRIWPFGRLGTVLPLPSFRVVMKMFAFFQTEFFCEFWTGER
jgi:hypothetical protein